MSLIAFRVSRLSGDGSGRLSRVPLWNFSVLHCLFGLMPLVIPGKDFAADTNAPPPAGGQAQEINFSELLKSTALMQEQLQEMRLAIEQDRKDASTAAAQNAQALSNGLLVLEQTFSAQRAQELETLQNSGQAIERSNRAMFITTGVIAGIGFLALLVLSWFQWRTSAKLAEIVAAWPMSRGLGTLADALALGPGELPMLPGESAEQANSRLRSALNQLDERIHQLKQSIVPGHNGEGDAPAYVSAARGAEMSQNDTGRVSELLQKAQSLASSANPEGALACFDEVLALRPDHAETLVRKGALLEGLHKLNEAIECYDRAIAADGSLTFAYLHKGGICSRLERFKEALECYEQALRTHEQRSNGR